MSERRMIKEGNKNSPGEEKSSEGSSDSNVKGEFGFGIRPHDLENLMAK